jgi:hypothetical protein
LITFNFLHVQGEGMPPNRSPRPYTTYELEQASATVRQTMLRYNITKQ